jgi:hypothetical protein
MGLSREDELDRAFSVSKDAHNPLQIVQEKVWALIRREAPCKAQSENVRVKHLSRLRNLLGRGAPKG